MNSRRPHRFSLIALLTSLTWAIAAFPVQAADKDQLQAPTHRQIRVIEPKVDGKVLKLHTIATANDGHLLAAVGGQSMQYVMNDNGTDYETKFVKEPGLVLMLDAEGNTIKQWELDLTPSALAVAPNDTIYVGGSGRIARLDADGSVTTIIDSPHVGNVDELRQKTAESIRNSRAQMGDVYKQQIEMLQERIATIEEKAEDDRSRLETAQLKAFKTQLEMFEKMMGDVGAGEGEDEGEVKAASIDDSELDSAVLQTMSVTSLAASDKDVFVCAMDPAGGGYGVWRVDADLNGESECILEGLRGCCGQMDIECCGEDLLVSENTNFKVGIYDRNGRSKTSFGGRDRTSRAGFGSCCNPMNSMAMSDGTILTAESSIGHIKRFDQEGNLVAYIGKAQIGGGCKHCALGYDEQNDLYYMMYQDKNGICVLANSEKTPATLAEKQLQQRQIDFLARAAGQWSMPTDTKDQSSSLLSWFGGGRGGSSQHPISALTLNADGSAKIVEGMYKAYGDSAAFELLEAGDDPESFNFALSIDQARFLEGSWKFDQEDTVTLTFQGLPSVTMTRSAATEACETACAGKDCQNGDCQDKNCPQANAVASMATEKSVPVDVPIVIESLEAATPNTGTLDLFFTEVNAAANPAPAKFAYKLVSKKDLGEDAEATLNQMGAEGWEYCGHVGKKMMFKRTGEVGAAK
jgi:hypothetical protein